MIKNEKGAALVMTLVVLVVMSILAVAFITVSASEYKFSVVEENKVKAYYVARSGADAVAAAIINDASKANELTEGVNEFNGEFDGEDFYVSVTKNGDFIHIVSTSTSGAITKTSDKSSVMLRKYSVEYLAKDIFTEVVTNGAFAVVDFDNPFSNGDFHGGTITESKDYNLLTTNNSRIIFDTNGGDLRIHAHTINVGDSIEIIGGGMVSLYVYDSATFQTPHSTINNADSDQLFLYVRDTARVDLQAHVVFNGYIYGPYASDIQTWAHSLINGQIVGPSSFGGHGGINYISPGDDVTLDLGTGGYEIHEWYE